MNGDSIQDHSRLESSDPSIARISSLAIEAAAQAIAQAKWIDRPIYPHQTALVVGTSKGPVEKWITSDKPKAAGESNFGLAELAHDVHQKFPLLDGPQLTFSAACASGLHALIRAAMMITCHEARRVLVIAAEASVHPLFLASFRRLGVFPPPATPCRPFDQHRSGFLMSDAAAAVCLESSSDCETPIVAVERFAFAGDASHLTANDPDAQTLRRIINHVVDHKPLDLIHAHGTATITNDSLELSAIESAVEKTSSTFPILYSHKAALGHSLGAAGLISIVLNSLSHQHSKIPGNIHTPNPLSSQCVSIPTAPTTRSIHRSIACASGFGGALAAVSLQNP